jgi:RNA polymerase sigma factor (sigma-70 family)
MLPQLACYDLDLFKMKEDALAVLAYELGFAPAQQELQARARQWTAAWVVCFLQGRRMKEADVADARQHAWLAVAEGLRKYRTDEVGKKNGCGVRTFLETVVKARLKDWFKKWWRRERRLDRSVNAALVCDTSRNVGRGGRSHLSAGSRDLSEPERMAQQREEQAWVRVAVSRLDGSERRLVELRLEGCHLHEVAEKLGIHYESAKRRWRKVQKKLQVWLRDLDE